MHDEVGHAELGVSRRGVGEGVDRLQAAVEGDAGEHQAIDGARITAFARARLLEPLDLSADLRRRPRRSDTHLPRFAGPVVTHVARVPCRRRACLAGRWPRWRTARAVVGGSPGRSGPRRPDRTSAGRGDRRFAKQSVGGTLTNSSKRSARSADDHGSSPNTVASHPVPPEPMPTVDATVGDVVERDQLLGERQRMPEVRRRDQGTQSHARGDERGGRQGGHGREPRLVAVTAPSQVVVGPRVGEVELLGSHPELAGGRPRHVGQDDHADAQRESRASRESDGFDETAARPRRILEGVPHAGHRRRTG